MRVLIITDDHVGGGSAVVAMGLAKQLDRVFEVHFAAMFTIETSQKFNSIVGKSVPFHDLSHCSHNITKTTYDYKSANELLNKVRPDFVLISAACVISSNLAVLQCCVKNSISFGIIVNGYWEKYPVAYNKAIHQISVEMASRADFVAFVSHQSKRDFSRDFPGRLKESSIRVITNCSDERFFSREPVDPKMLRKQLGYKDSDFIVLLPARVEEAKGHHLLITALKNAQQSGELQNAKIILLGGEQGNFGNTLRDSISRQHIKSSVDFMGFKSDIQPYLEIANVVVLPSYSEGMPLAICEAMAAGKMIIATDVGDIGIFLSPDVGFLIASPSVNAVQTVRELSAALIQVSRGKTGITRDYIRKVALRNFHPDDNFVSYKNAILDSISNRHPTETFKHLSDTDISLPVNRTVSVAHTLIYNFIGSEWGPLDRRGVELPHSGANFLFQPDFTKSKTYFLRMKFSFEGESENKGLSREALTFQCHAVGLGTEFSCHLQDQDHDLVIDLSGLEPPSNLRLKWHNADTPIDKKNAFKVFLRSVEVILSWQDAKALQNC